MDTQNILIIIITAIVLAITVVIAIERQHIEPQEIHFELRRELPNGTCLYSISTPPHDRYNGYLRTDCRYKNRSYKITE